MSGPHREAAIAARAALFALGLVGALAACTARQGYEGLRTGARNDCALHPASEYQRCVERLEMDYASYRALPTEPAEALATPASAAAPVTDDAEAERGDDDRGATGTGSGAPRPDDTPNDP